MLRGIFNRPIKVANYSHRGKQREKFHQIRYQASTTTKIAMDLLNSSTESDGLDCVPVFHSTPLRGVAAQPPIPQSPLAFIDLSSTTTASVWNSITSSDSNAIDGEVSKLSFNDLSTEETILGFPLIPDSCGPRSKPFCCDNDCIESISPLEREQIRRSFSSRSRSDQPQFLFDIVIASAKRDNENDILVDGYILSGKKLCQNAFLKVLSIWFVQ